MKTIGVLGGLTWHSTLAYYKILNETVAHNCGGINSAKIILISLNFGEFYALQQQKKYTELSLLVESRLAVLKNAGADFVIIASNTAHKYLPNNQFEIPVLHIADASADCLADLGITKIGLLGTEITCTESFFISKLQAKGINVLVPEVSDLKAINSVIFNELAVGNVTAEACNLMQQLFEKFKNRGAEAVLLACTELIMITEHAKLALPYYDTAELHAIKAANFATLNL